MKILLYGNLHHKNEKGTELLKEKIEVIKINDKNDLKFYKDQEYVYLICGNSFEDIDFPKVIYGPQIDLITIINFCNQNKDKKIKINLLSDWNKKLTQKFISESKAELICLPFPVDINKFKPENKDDRCFIYFKNTHSSKLEIAKKLLEGYNYKIFSYGSYKEEEYLDWIAKSKFGIWVGCHESQGFALQESLSCNCPLFVLNVQSLKDECFNDNYYPWINTIISYDNLEATSASYWDERCGILVNDIKDVYNLFEIFIKNLEIYKPREFVIENFTIDNFVNNLKKI